MKLIDEVFKRYKVIEESLISYGFRYSSDVYTFNKKIYNDSFELQLIIKNGFLQGKLIDLDFNDEFSQINIESSSSFISDLKEECRDVLIDIRNNCFFKEPFVYAQSNRITKMVEDMYNVSPEYLWDTDPGFGVFRNSKTNKWFGIIMNIPKNKIVGEENREIEVLNVMLHEKTSDYLNGNGIYPAYHMNKKNWVSIVLDDTLQDDEIIKLIDISYSYSNIKGKIISNK